MKQVENKETMVIPIGSILKCTRDDSRSHAFIQGNEYTIVGYDADGDYMMMNEAGFVSYNGCPLNGNLWDFEEVK
jgi:hypothetical protein|nr:MAG TPA: hypothetical protein [Caudoviricetes sp.]